MAIQFRLNRMFLAYLSLYVAFAAAAARAVFELYGDSGFPIMLGFLTFYLLSLIIEPALIKRSLVYLHVINVMQTAIVLLLLLFIGDLDYFALLFVPPCTQSILNLPRRSALAWILSITLMMVTALLITFPANESIGFVIIYPTAIFLFASLSYLAKRAGEAQDRSELLLADLQKANQKLQAYAAQVKELAAASERNRLARELHDSVTQIIFGLTLSAQAARILLERNPSRVAAELDHLQVLSQSALSEMRALIQELHPNSLAEEGLISALQRLVREKQANDGLKVDLQVKGEKRLPPNIESELYRVVQEATNNIVKHAHTDHASIVLDLEDPERVKLTICDNGAGFDVEAARPVPGHLGLTSMIERIEALSGNLEIESAPGKGTRLTVIIALEQEVEDAG